MRADKTGNGVIMNFSTRLPVLAQRLLASAKFRLISLDYALLSFVARHVPLALGRLWAIKRGMLHILFNYDWRSYAVGMPFVRTRTWQSLRLLHPAHSRLRLLATLIGRYVNSSLEEWEVLALDRLIERLPVPASDDLAQQEELPAMGTVYVMFHYGSFILGMAWLGRHLAARQQRLHVMASNLFLHPQVHPAAQRLFQRKYELLEHFLNGGKVVYIEDGLKPFYKLLKAGDGLFVLTDNISKVERAVRADFCGMSQVPFVPGTQSLLERTGACYAPFACHYHRGQYRLILGSRVADVASLPAAITFHGNLVDAYPQRWLASDLLVG